MWMWFFRICDFFCRFIPNRQRRAYLRQVKLYDWYRKYHTLKQAFPNLNFHKTKMVKGGWNIGFIIDKKYVFKVRKQVDTNIPHEKIILQQRITAALAPFSPIQVLDIEVIKLGQYVFYKYPFIRGRNLNTFRYKTILRHRNALGRQIAEFIYKIHNAKPKEIKDLITPQGDGWNHNDICNNLIVNPRNMKIIGIIDWEYAGWGYLDTEFKNCTRFSKSMKNSGIGDVIRTEYNKFLK
ncbi:MAG: phosphotransferase [Alphaproteobacteria bacterium]|nr:phosphotransferase [Alphaproteobacteria bacterium]